MDYLFIRFMLRHLQINEGDAAGSNLFAATEGIKSQIEKMPNARLKTVFLFSDGGDSRLESLRGAEREEAMQSLLSILGDAQAIHLQIFTIGLGTQEGGIVPEVVYQGNTVRSVLDEEPLRRLARRGGGEYFDANRASALEIADELNRVLIQRKAKKESISAESSTEMSYDLFFQIPLACAILLLAFILFWPEHRLSINGLSTRVLTTKSLLKF
jgi:Ca-activated chloride channel family protein